MTRLEGFGKHRYSLQEGSLSRILDNCILYQRDYICHRTLLDQALDPRLLPAHLPARKDVSEAGLGYYRIDIPQHSSGFPRHIFPVLVSIFFLEQRYQRWDYLIVHVHSRLFINTGPVVLSC